MSLIVTPHEQGLLVRLKGESKSPFFWNERSATNGPWHDWRAGDEGIDALEDALLLRPSYLWRLSEEQRDALGILGIFGGNVEIVEEGPAGRPNYRWKVKWDGISGAPFGVWVGDPNKRLLISEELEPVLTLLADLDIARGDEIETYKVIARLKDLQSSRPRQVQLTGRLASRSVHIVDSVQVHHQTNERGEYEPVPVVAVRNQEGGSTAVSISPKGTDRLGAMPLSGGKVSLGDDHFAVVTPEAAEIYLTTSLAAHAPKETRERFIADPVAFFADSSAFDDSDYSSRVIGMGEAPKPDPFAAGKSNALWAGESVGLYINTVGGELAYLAPDDVNDLQSKVHSAISAGAADVTWRGHQFPVSTALADALETATRPNSPAPTQDEIEPTAPVKILQIRENGLSLEYCRWRGPARTGKAGIPEGIRVALKPHQTTALHQLQKMWLEGWSGALLCDDMGLGKTLQSLVFAAWVHAMKPECDIPVLLVADPTLLENWLDEIENRLDLKSFRDIIWGLPRSYPGTRTDRIIRKIDAFILPRPGNISVLPENVFDINTLRATKVDIVVTTYDVLRKYQASFGKLKFGLILADEVQRIKNDSSLRSHALRAMNYDFALALTGTPIENSWLDLWTLCDFAIPGRLGSRSEFRKAYPDGGDSAAESGARLSNEVSEFLIRRTRAQAIPELPARERREERCEMPHEQRLAYDAARVQYTREKIPFFAFLRALARVSLHPIIRADFVDRQEVDQWMAKGARTAIAWSYLKRYREQRKSVLIFIESREFQKTFQRALLVAMGLEAPILNGEIPASERAQILRDCREKTGFQVIIVAPKVGGVGLNMQFATRAILLERPWNPAQEAQMVARIHRLGQQFPVEIVYPLATHPDGESFDEKLHSLLMSKQELAENVLMPIEMSEGSQKAHFSSLV